LSSTAEASWLSERQIDSQKLQQRHYNGFGLTYIAGSEISRISTPRSRWTPATKPAAPLRHSCRASRPATGWIRRDTSPANNRTHQMYFQDDWRFPKA